MNCAVPPPASADEADTTWKLCGSALRFIAKEAMTMAGLRLNFSKCYALAPPGIPDPPPGALPDGTSLVRDGIKLAGAPIGTDQF